MTVQNVHVDGSCQACRKYIHPLRNSWTVSHQSFGGKFLLVALVFCWCGFISAKTWLLWLLIILFQVCDMRPLDWIKPLSKLLPPGIFHWTHCLICLLMMWVQLLLLCYLANGSVKCICGISNSACARWGCVSNHIRDHFLQPESGVNLPVHSHASWNLINQFEVYFIWPTRCNLYNVLYYYQRPTCFGCAFRPSSGAYKTVCAALGIVMLCCCLALVWMGWNLVN